MEENNETQGKRKFQDKVKGRYDKMETKKGRFDKVYKELGLNDEHDRYIYEKLDKDESIKDEIKDYVAFRCGKMHWGKYGVDLYSSTRLEKYAHDENRDLTAIVLNTYVECYGKGKDGVSIDMSETSQVNFKDGKFISGRELYNTGG